MGGGILRKGTGSAKRWRSVMGRGVGWANLGNGVVSSYSNGVKR